MFRVFVRSRLGLVLSVVLALALFGHGAAASQPAAETFFSNANVQNVTMSPSGRWLASLVGGGGMRDRLVLTDLEEKEPPRILAVLKTADVSSFSWVDDNWLTYSVSSYEERSGKRKAPGLLAVNRAGDRTRLLIRRDYEKEVGDRVGARVLYPDHFLMARGKAGTNEIVVGHANFDPVGRSELTHVTPLALDIENGATRKLVDQAIPNVTSWLLDWQGQPRLALSSEEPGYTSIYWSDGPQSAWRKIAKFAWLKEGWEPAFVANDNLFVYRSTGPNSEKELYRFDFATGKPEPEPWISTPGFDATASPIFSPQSGALVGVRLRAQSTTTVWIEPTLQAIQQQIDTALPGRVNVFQCGPCHNPRQVLVRSYTDRDPGQFLLFYPNDGRLERVAVARTAVDPDQAHTVQLHRFAARDGMEIPVWVTGAPANGKAPKPAIVLVHGGPWARGGDWRWDADAQFLASRGYVVIEPEFRGSTGYGQRHFRAGWKQWGQTMQDDVSDALQYAVAQGWADKQRACIAGASYGGYAALMGAAKTPEQYRCVVSWVGVTDPSLMFALHWSDIPEEAKNHSMPTLIGDPVSDAAMLSAHSPLKQAARIKAPVLLAYGVQDRRVPIEHGHRMRAALESAGNAPVWLEYDGEGHGWQRLETKLDFWNNVERFLSKHLSR